MAKRNHKRKFTFFHFMLIYACIFLVLIAVGVRYLQSYLADYEATRSSTFLSSTMDSLDAEALRNMASGFVSTLDTNLKSEKESYQVIDEYLKDGVTCSKKVAESTDSDMVYALMSHDEAVGELEIVQSSENDSFGFKPWSVARAEIELPQLINSFTVTVPETWSVICNGYGLDGSYVTETGLHYDFLEDYYEDYPDLPTKMTYTVTNYIGDLDTVILNASGEEVTLDPDAGDIQFAEPLSDDENTALKDFFDKFLTAYFKYTSGLGSFTTVTRYIVDGSALEERLDAAQDSLEWSHTTSVSIDSWSFNSVTKADASTLLVDISTVETTEGPQGGTYDINLKLVVTESLGGNYEIAALDLY